MNEQVFDIAIIGGGINGCGCAADAALRGLSVILLEEADLASKTSSSSSKLIHGGLRYLEQFDFTLVKKALDEQQQLLTIAPYLIHPLAFVLPYEKNMRPRWLLQFGLFIYDHLSRKNQLPDSQSIARKANPKYFSPLDSNLTQGFIYYDCLTDDSRLTIANALQAKAHGATILNYTQLIDAKVQDNRWLLSVKTPIGEQFIQAKSVINAAGPWVEKVSQCLQVPMLHAISLVKGSHILVDRLYEGDHAYILQNTDKRIIFAIPYENHTLVGTTEISCNNAENPRIEATEISYLFAIIQRYFNKTLTTNDIKHTWSGLRPLLYSKEKSPRVLSRDYLYHLDTKPAPSITLYGGKITTYRKLAEEAVNALQAVFPNMAISKTVDTPLPGSQLDTKSYQAYASYAEKNYVWLNQETLRRWLRTYGTRTAYWLDSSSNEADLGHHFGHGLYQVEVDYLLREEWASSSEDILWRRTKLGLYFSEAEKKCLDAYIIDRPLTV